MTLVVAIGCVVVRNHRSPGHAAPSVPAGRGQPTLTDPPVSAAPDAPNIVLISTDDQDVPDLAYMPRTQRLLVRAGMTFTRALSPQPLCCPARAEILTGQYAQNNGVRHNHGPWGGARRLHPSSTVATWLSQAGYRTAFVGKYLNEFGRRSPRPPGWTIWDPMLTKVYSYYGTTFLRRGPAATSGLSSVDEVTSRSVSALRELAARPGPFFLWSSQVAPHAGPRVDGRWLAPPASRADRAVVDGVTAPPLRKPSFDVPADPRGDVVGETGWFSRGYIQRYFAHRVGVLQGVDREVATVLAELRRAHRLRDTYVFFTTDNANLLGEHGILGKNSTYEEALRIPFVVRGPGIRRDTRSPAPVTLVDLAPTFAELARATPDIATDGTSFLPLLHGRPLPWRDTQLIQTGSNRRPWAERGVRTKRYTFAVDMRTGRQVLYDRRRDPYEMVDRSGDPRYRHVVRELLRRTGRLTHCRAAECRPFFGPVPRPGGARRG